MARLVYALPCLNVLQDDVSGAPSYISIVEGVTVPSTPAEIVPFKIATYWFNPDEVEARLHLRLKVLSPGGATVLEKALDPDLLAPLHHLGRYRINIGAPRVKVDEIGVFDYLIQRESGGEWTTEASLPISVESASESVSEESGSETPGS